MHKFIEDTYKFNKLGGCPQDQSYKNLVGGLELIEEETREMEDTFMQFLRDDQEWTSDNQAEFLDALVDLLVVTIGAGYRAGLKRTQIELAMSLVAEANMAKFNKTEKDAVKSVSAYDGDDRYSDVHYEAIDIEGERFYAVIGKTKEGNRKILKGHSWVDPKKMIKQICR